MKQPRSAPSSDRYHIHYGYAWIAVFDSKQAAYVFSASCPHEQRDNCVWDAADQIAIWLATPEFEPPLDARMNNRPIHDTSADDE